MPLIQLEVRAIYRMQIWFLPTLENLLNDQRLHNVEKEFFKLSLKSRDKMSFIKPKAIDYSILYQDLPTVVQDQMSWGDKITKNRNNYCFLKCIKIQGLNRMITMDHRTQKLFWLLTFPLALLSNMAMVQAKSDSIYSALKEWSTMSSHVPNI